MAFYQRITFLTIILGLLNCSADSSPTSSEDDSQTDRPGWKLVWSDEFNEDGLPDPQKWTYDVGGEGWGNNELQYYTAGVLDNARVQDGKLTITALREQFSSNNYTSARLLTKGRGEWKYGRIEVLAKIPSGRGTWSAIWMLPTVWNYGNGSWPDNGEIDIMEHVGFDGGKIHGTVHTDRYNSPNGTQKGSSINVVNATSAFHVYAIEWSEEKIDFFVDEANYFTYENEKNGWQTWPFNKEFHLLLNIAVGGDWGGIQGIDNSVFPARMEIEYVRVYEKEN